MVTPDSGELNAHIYRVPLGPIAQSSASDQSSEPQSGSIKWMPRRDTWRVAARYDADMQLGYYDVPAAPWWLDWVWQASILGDDRPLRPSRARRRAGLRLTWPVRLMSAPVGTVPQLRVRLSNAGERAWRNDGADYGHVTVRLLGPGGERLPKTLSSPWRGGDMVGAAVHLLPTLPPGSPVDLTPAWDTSDIPSLPPGDYGVVAELNDLRLRCGPEALQLRLR